MFLATIPVVIAYPLAAGIEKYTLKRHSVPWIVWLLPFIAWFSFVPNTCYLLTEWRHFIFDAPFASHRDPTGGDDPMELLHVARQGLFFVGYSLYGAICFALSIRPIHRLIRAAKGQVVLFAVPFFLLVSLGVYMGLVLRLNSWDILNRPGYVLWVAKHAFETPLLLETIAAFAGILWLLYMVIDIWFDGLKGRLKHSSHVVRA